jgi:hypothetical protein
MTPAIRTFRPHLVQTATAWGTWISQPDLECILPREGAGQVVGSAALRYRFGLVRQSGVATNPGSVTPLASLLAQWVRVLIQSNTGSVSANGDTWDPLWHGEASAVAQTDDGGGVGEQQLQCLGIANALARLVCNRGIEKRWSASGGGPYNLINPGFLPAFNAEATGDMYTSDVDVDGNGSMAKCHTRGRIADTSNSVKWTAFEIIRLLLALFARGQVAPAFTYACPLAWTVSDPQGLLAFTPPNLNLNGLRLLDAINVLINPRRGLTWSVTISGNSAVITPVSLSPVAITNGPFTLPAATRVATPDLSSSHFIDEVTLTEDQSATYDAIRVLGERPWVAATVVYKNKDTGADLASGGLVKGWDTGLEEYWTKSNHASGNIGSFKGVWRRWVLDDSWTGNCNRSETSGLRETVKNDGTRTFTGIGTWAPQTLELTADLPVSPGFSTLAKGPRQQAVAVGSDGANNFVSLTGDLPQEASYRLQLSVEQQPPAIWVGSTPDDGRKAKDLLGSTKYDASLYLTVGFREQAPLMVEWQRASGLRPRDLPRTLTVQVADCEQWIALKGCVTGVSDDGLSLFTLSNDVTARDDTPTLHQTLTLLRAFYGETARSLEWFDAGTIETSSTFGPGALVTTATLSTGTVTVNATITTRSWDLSEAGFGTRYSTARLFAPMDLYR